MPTAPIPNNQPLQQNALPNVRVADASNAEAFGAGQSSSQLNQAASNLITQVARIAGEEKRKADDIAATEAYAKTIQYKNNLMYDPKTGAMTKRGKDAFGVMDEYVGQFDKFTEDIEKNLGNDDQRALYQKIKAQHRTDLSTDLQKHIFMEGKKFDDETTESGLLVTREDAVLNFQNPGKVTQSIEMQKALIMSHAGRNGLPAEWVKAKTEDVTSKTHMAVVNRMLAQGDDLLASEYFAAVKDQFTGSDVTMMEKTLQEGQTRGESRRLADSIVSKVGSMTAALAEAKKIKDPKVYDATVDRIKDHFTLQKAAEAERVDRIYRRASNIIDDAGSIDAIPPADWDQFSVSEKAALKAYAKQKREGTDIVTDMPTYYALKDMASDPNTRADFLKMDLIRVQHKLSKADLKEFIDVQTKARDGENKTLDGWRTDQQIVDGALASMGIDPNKKSNAEVRENFRRQAEQLQMQKARQLGRPLNNDEMQDIVDNLKVKGITERGLWNTTKRLYELTPEDQQFEVDIKDVPGTERLKIIAAFKKHNRGQEPTESDILLWYTRKLEGLKRGY